MIYIIGDLHLSFGVDKPMNIFGNVWENHTERLEENWKKVVKDEDTVFLAGDFSWAMTLEEALEDFKYIDRLPGKKILLKGNHDYWWSSIKKNREFLEKNGIKNVDFLYNNSYIIENIAFCGTRGWEIKDIEEIKHIRKENIRLNNSIQDMNKKIEEYKLEIEKKIAIFHYPPITKEYIEKGLDKELGEYDIIKTLKKEDIRMCYYGHLHGILNDQNLIKKYDNIKFELIASDYVNFKLINIK